MKKQNKNKQKKHCARQHPQSESERIKVDDFKASLIIITVVKELIQTKVPHFCSQF